MIRYPVHILSCRVIPVSDRGSSEIDLPEAFFHFVDPPAVPGNCLGIGTEFFSERDRNGIHHLSPSELHDPVVFLFPALKTFLQSAAALTERPNQTDGSDSERSGIDIVGRLAHIHIIEWMKIYIFARLMAHVSQAEIGKHFIHVHVCRRSGTALQGIGRKCRTERMRITQDLIAGRNDCLCFFFLQSAGIPICQCGCFLHGDHCCDQFHAYRSSGYLEVGKRPGSFNSVQTLLRKLHRAKQVFFFSGSFFHRSL